MNKKTYHPYDKPCEGGCDCNCDGCIKSREEQRTMKPETSRWIILRQDRDAKLCMVDGFDVERDPTQALVNMLSRTNTNVPGRTFYALVFPPKRQVELRLITDKPTTELLQCGSYRHLC